MKKITAIFKSIPKSLLAFFGLLAVVLVPAAIMAWGPDRPTFTMAKPATYVTFNSITDNPLVGDERNFTRIRDVNTATWSDNATMQEGHEYEVRMYVHNNAASNYGLVAHNVRASFGLPTTYSNAFELNGIISADNANPQKVWDQVIVQGDRQFKVNYVAGSAKYYNNSVGVNGVALGNDLFTTTGAQLGWTSMNGDIPGCMEYSGYVLLRIKPEFKPVPNDFTVNKQVRKVGTTTWSDSIKANPGDTLEYQIEYKNTGEVTQTNVVIKDTLPQGISYIGGTTMLYNASSPNGKTVPDGVTTTGINIGSYTPGSNAFVRFKAKVVDNEALPKCGTNTYTNVASAKPDGLNPKEDDADAEIPKDCQPASANFEMNKKVRIAGQTEWKDSVTAKPGDTLEYRINFKNTGETELTNVMVKDTLPQGVTYVNGSSKLFNDANPNGTAIADGVTANGVNIGNYQPNQTAAVQFQAKLPGADQMKCGDNAYKNVANVKPDGQNPKEDDADTTVPKECAPSFEMNKKVRVAGQTEWQDSVKAKPGDTLEYRINFKNTGETTLTNVIVRDTLPNGVTYVDGSSQLFNDANPDGKTVGDGVVTAAGLNIGDYAPGKTAAVQFKAKIADNDNLPACGDNVLKNIAKVQPDGQGPKEDDADTTVPKDCPVPPTPKFTCELLTADRNTITKGETVNFHITPQYSGDKVTVKEYKMDFGDAQTQIKDVADFAHVYATANTYTAQAWVTYDVNGKTETVTSDACKKPITVTETPVNPCPWNPSIPIDHPDCVPPAGGTTPSGGGILPATGAAALGGVIGAGALTLGISSWLTSRRVLRSMK